MIYDYLILILFGGIALRGLQWLFLMQERTNQFLPFWAITHRGRTFVSVSNVACLALGFFNGYLLDGFLGMLIVGFSTHSVAPLLNNIMEIPIIRSIAIFHPLYQFYLLWPAYFIYSIINLISLF
jgi:hypothetical protein